MHKHIHMHMHNVHVCTFSFTLGIVVHIYINFCSKCQQSFFSFFAPELNLSEENWTFCDFYHVLIMISQFQSLNSKIHKFSIFLA